MTASTIIDQAFILAAGLGTRLRPLTSVLPKPLLPLAGRPLLGFFLDHLDQLGISRAGINIHHLAGQIREFLESREKGPALTVFEEEGRALGTGGGLGQAGGFLGSGTTLVISPKILFDFDLREVSQGHRESGAVVTMVLIDRPGYNRVHLRGERIVGFREDRHPDPAGISHLAYTSIQVVEPVVFDYLPRSGPGDMIESYRGMIRDGHLLRGHILGPDALWLNLADLGDYLEFHRKVLAEGRPAFGYAPKGPVLIEKTARVSDRATIQGFAYLGQGVKVAAGSYVRDSVILEGAVVDEGARLIQSVLGPGARAGGVVEGRALVA